MPPEGTSAGAKLGIIAGGGTLPLRLAQACAVQGRAFHLIGLKSMAGPEIEAHPHDWTALGTVGHTLEVLRRTGCGAVIMAGYVKRPDFSALQLDFTGTRLLPRIVMAARGGDDKLLRVLVTYFEEQGFAVVGVDEVMEALLAPAGAITRETPVPEDEGDIAQGVKVVAALGGLDVGQGAVVARGLVLAVEAAEGTDAMLRRCAELPAHLRGSATARAGVLVKLAKPGQERRIDLPTIGVATVEGAAAAGLRGIAIEAGAALMIDRERIIEAADRLGLFVVGLPARETGV